MGGQILRGKALVERRALFPKTKERPIETGSKLRTQKILMLGFCTV